MSVVVGAVGERTVKLREVQRAVVRVEQRCADEDEEAGERGQDQHLESGLERDRPLQEEAGQPVAGERSHLEPDEQVEEVGGQRRPISAASSSWNRHANPPSSRRPKSRIEEG